MYHEQNAGYDPIPGSTRKGNDAMRKNYRMKIVLVFVSLLLLLFVLGCLQPGDGGSPSEMFPQIQKKQLITTGTPVEAICYVDVEKDKPLNAKDYIFSASATTSEIQFFNYVVLGHAYLAKNERGYTYLKMTSALEYILANSKTYIKPLQQKGIQVLVEVRSGNFSDTDNGISLGLGTMDMAAIGVFAEELKRLINHYGFNGFEFNDTGGGKSAYPPSTQTLTRFQSGESMYPAELFTTDGKKDSPSLSAKEIEDKLWIEGGSNFSNLILWTNETLKETYDDSPPLVRIILVRTTNHGSHLLSKLRDAYMPDAYSGADPKVVGNLNYMVNTLPYDNSHLYSALYDETQEKYAEGESDDKYAPFAIDLADQKDQDTARSLVNTFLYDSSGTQNQYGALYFTNLPSVSSQSDANALTTYMSHFSLRLFGRNVNLVETPNAGDYKKTW
jgi:hypothetical protein